MWFHSWLLVGIRSVPQGVSWQSSGWDSVLSAEGPGSTPGGGTKIPETIRCNQKETTLFPSPTHINLPTIPWKEGLESNKQGARRGRELGEQGKGLPRDALTPTVLWRTRKLPGGRMCKSTVNKEPL